MASYNPPLENITDFNTTLFNNDIPITSGGTGDLTKAQADTYYLSKINTDTSTATLTTFNNSLTLKNILTLYDSITPFSNYVEILQSSITTTFRQLFNSGKFDFISKNSGGTNNTSLTVDSTGITVGGVLKTVTIQSSNTSSNNKLFDNLTTGGSITIGTAGFSNTINGSTTTMNTNVSLGSSNSVSSNFYYFQSATGAKNLFTNATTATITFASSTSTTSFNGVSTFNQEVIIPTRLTLKGVQYANEVLTISGISATLTFPLQQHIMLSSTGATINITLPTINASTQVGVIFYFNKIGSVTNSVIFTAGGTNQILPYGSITNTTPYTGMINTTTSISLTILEITTGVFAWREL